jgi:hypothetical protein
MKAYQVDERRVVWALTQAPRASFLEFRKDSIENRPFSTVTSFRISRVGRLIGCDQPVGKAIILLNRDRRVPVDPWWCNRQA